MNPSRALVVGYVDALGVVGEAVRAAMPSLVRLADILGLVRSRQIARRGEAGGYQYAVHGAGCRFTAQDGTEVDVDFAADGTEIFDLWRLRLYGQSLPAPVTSTEDDLRAVVESLSPLLTEVRPGWFTVTRRPVRPLARHLDDGPPNGSMSSLRERGDERHG
ncbi:DUF6896 domain-containing protein [Streptomyces sp. NPDC001935]